MSSSPQANAITKQCKWWLGGGCQSIPSLPSSPTKSGANTLTIFIGDGSFDRESRVFPRFASSSIERCHQLRWILWLDEAAIANWNAPRITVSIITQWRLASLTRLTQSLLDAEYFGQKVDLSVSIDYDADHNEAIAAHIRDLQWPHGRKMIRRRTSKAGLVTHVMEILLTDGTTHRYSSPASISCHSGTRSFQSIGFPSATCFFAASSLLEVAASALTWSWGLQLL